jgi:hypothetical protein
MFISGGNCSQGICRIPIPRADNSGGNGACHGNELFSGLFPESVRSTDAIRHRNTAFYDAVGTSPTVFSVMEKPVADEQKLGFTSEKSVPVSQTVVSTTKTIALIVETMVSTQRGKWSP